MQTVIYEAVLIRDFRKDGEPALSGDEVWTYLAVLGRLAALDGATRDELEFIHRAAASLGLSGDVARNAHRIFSDSSVSTEKLVQRIHDPGLRLCLLRDAYRLASTDDRISDAELREVAVIAKALGIEHHTATEVRSVALQESRLQREFSRLVEQVRA